MCGMPERLRACVEKCGEFINNENMNQSLFVFLLLHAIEGAINFGTPCMCVWVCEGVRMCMYARLHEACDQH